MATALIPLASGCEELEAVTIIDLLRRADITVISAALEENPVVANRGTVLVADTMLSSVVDREFDLIALPGGLPGTDHLCADSRILSMLKRALARGGRVAAICAAPKVLAKAELLEGRRVSAYPGVMEAVEGHGAKITNEAVEVDGSITTSRGPGTAIRFALTLIAQLKDPAIAKQVEAALAG